MQEQSFDNELFVLREEKERATGTSIIRLPTLVRLEDLISVILRFYRFDYILVRNAIHKSYVLENLRSIRDNLNIDIRCHKIVLALFIF